MKKNIIYCFLLITINSFSQENSTTQWEKKLNDVKNNSNTTKSEWDLKLKEKENQINSTPTIWDQKFKDKENESYSNVSIWDQKIAEKENKSTPNISIWDKKIVEKESEISIESKFEKYWLNKINNLDKNEPLTAKQKSIRFTEVALTIWIGYFYSFNKYQDYDIKQTRKLNGW